MKLNRRLFRFETRIDDLVETISNQDKGIYSSRRISYVVERTVVQFQIEWELFVRGVILDSATGRYEGKSGKVCSTKIRRILTREQASYELIGTYKKCQKEPDWYLPPQAINAAQRLHLTNFQNVANSLGVTPWIIDDLRYIRNFIAHRSKQSALKLRQKGLASPSGRICPVYCVYAYNNVGVKNYLYWAKFMKAVASNLVSH